MEGPPLFELTLRIPFLKDGKSTLIREIARILGVSPRRVGKVICLRRSIDARKKNRMIYVVYRVAVEVVGDVSVPEGVIPYRPPDGLKVGRVSKGVKPLIVGMGPAGLFCALALTEAGVKGSIIERGCPVEERVRKVEELWRYGRLDPSCNPQFGEGGAGTFSDGKLTTRVRDSRIRWIFDKLVEMGAPKDILCDAKPHVGTDVIRKVVRNIRERLIAAGWEVSFNTALEDVEIDSGRLGRVRVNGEWMGFSHVVLAVGHSARDTYRMLVSKGVPVSPKPFAVGFRIEHPQSLIDEAQYGRWAGHPKLPPATYHLTCNFKEHRRGVYTFCMCPGGYVICASSSPGELVVNGMSYRARDSGYANAAVVVTVDERDFPGGVLGGVEFQETVERVAFGVAGGYRAPAQQVSHFVYGGGCGGLSSTYRPGVVPYPVEKILPGHLVPYLREALRVFGRKIKGFDSEGVIVAPETRTSSPLRILRDETMQSVGAKGLYPCGEGAGYAGGIVSSALDGLRVAEAIVAECG